MVQIKLFVGVFRGREHWKTSFKIIEHGTVHNL